MWTEQEIWVLRLAKSGFLTEAVAAVQGAAQDHDVELKAEPWQIAKGLGEMMEKGWEP